MNELVWSDDLADVARRTRDEVATVLAGLGVPGELVLTGATSVPGALTRGDVDLHLRVSTEDFASAVTVLGAVYPVGSPHSWAETLAVFDVPGPRATGLAVTPLGSPHDVRFRTTWQVLRASPELLAELNAVKRACAGTDAYEDRKSAFFSFLLDRPAHG